MVRIRSFSLSSVRAAMMAGTLQPNPISMGIKDFPCRPIRCMILSIKKAALDIYPVSSKREMQKKRIRMLGKNTMTLPTPAITPSKSNSLIRDSGRMLSTTPENPPITASIHCMGYSPRVKVDWNIIQINKIKMGNPTNLLVRTRSIFREMSTRC